MSEENFRLSVVLPVYNQADVIEEVIRDFDSKILQKLPGSEIIIAEDGSTDGTKEILARLREQVNFRLISGAERKGYKKAFIDAMKLPENDFVLFCDSDKEFEPGDFWKMKPFAGEYDIVVGVRQGNRSATRLILSKLNMIFIALLFQIHLKDINCPFRLMKRSVVDDIIKDVGITIHPSTEFIIRAKKKGYRVKEVPIVHYKTPSEFFSPKKAPRIALRSLYGLLKLRMAV